jgi:hypothetical protein
MISLTLALLPLKIVNKARMWHELLHTISHEMSKKGNFSHHLWQQQRIIATLVLDVIVVRE